MPVSEPADQVRRGSLVVTPELDVPYLETLCRDPEIYARTADDQSPASERLDLSNLLRMPGVLCLKVWRTSRAVGAFLFLPAGPEVLEVHTVMTRDCRGRRAVEAGLAGLEYVFTRTGCWKITSRCPEDNPASLWYALRLGFNIEFHRADWPRAGKLLSSAHVALTKADWILNNQNQQEVLCH